MESNEHNWLVTVVGTGQKGVFKPGDLVIIGRTPKHLPTPGSSFMRFNIDNPQKSMSKRHVSLQIRRGAATIKDLGSTNGTYLVKKNGALVRLPAGEEFLLDKSPVRLQLGNVGILLEKTAEEEEGGKGKKEGDLFANSSSAPSAPRSVKDIREAMEEREGEPTFLIDADRVAEKVREKREKAQEAPGEAPIPSATEEAENEEAQKSSSEEENIEKIQEENKEKAKLVDKAIEERLKSGPAPLSAPSSATVPLPAAGTGAGSLFERLSRQKRRQNGVIRLENGMTSEEAERTESFARQFELAKHREMLPFLALNPNLYSDLYMWLEALGDPVISAALQTNRGYQAFKKDGGNDGRI
ncbi:MAG: FHA domain-containing protein [Aeriscardovia sp.]|nr:FHA domain-containing protein [Aeriscardovia sp.]